MNWDLYIELFGYLGSTLVVVSMLMASVVKLRVINTIGSVISGTYALIIGSFPLALMNICLLVINLYNLFKLLRVQQEYDIVQSTAEDSFVRYFLNHYNRDIDKFFPDFTAVSGDLDAVYLVCCNGNPAGLLMGRCCADGGIDVELDYSIPAYRDCSVGNFLYPRLADMGIRELRFMDHSAGDHSTYLKKMGFTESNGTFIKRLC